MEKILMVTLITLSLAAAASAQALHVVHMHILKEKSEATCPVFSKACKEKNASRLGALDVRSAGFISKPLATRLGAIHSNLSAPISGPSY